MKTNITNMSYKSSHNYDLKSHLWKQKKKLQLWQYMYIYLNNLLINQYYDFSSQNNVTFWFMTILMSIISNFDLFLAEMGFHMIQDTELLNLEICLYTGVMLICWLCLIKYIFYLFVLFSMNPHHRF